MPNKMQVIKDVTKIKSPIFELNVPQIREILLQMGLIENIFCTKEIVNFGFLEVNKFCPKHKQRKDAKKITAGGRIFFATLEETPGKRVEKICTVYRAKQK